MMCKISLLVNWENDGKWGLVVWDVWVKMIVGCCWNRLFWSLECIVGVML